MEPTADPCVALGAMAVRTERIRLGTLVTPIARRRIEKLAREVITLDRLSGGRAVLGVGLGFMVLPEYTGFGDEPRTESEMSGSPRANSFFLVVSTQREAHTAPIVAATRSNAGRGGRL